MSIFTGLSILIHVKGGEGVSRCGLVRVGFSGHAKCVRFYMWFQLPLSEEIFRNLTKKRTFYLKPQTTSKFEKICHPKTLRNRKPHIKPHFKGTKTANRTRNRISKSLKPQPATHCTPPHQFVTQICLFQIFGITLREGTLDPSAHRATP